MRVTTIRLDENTIDALDAEKVDHGFRNRAEYVRWIIEHRDRIRENTLAPGDAPAAVDELRARVARLADEVDGLRDQREREGEGEGDEDEDEREGGEQPRGTAGPIDGTSDRRDAVADVSRPLSGSAPGDTPDDPDLGLGPDVDRGRDRDRDVAEDVDDDVPDGRALAGVDFPAGRDRDECEAAVLAAHAVLREVGPASKREIVAAVMPTHPIRYDVVELEEGDRFRGAWWRKVVKPGLEALPDVEKPHGGGDWRHIE